MSAFLYIVIAKWSIFLCVAPCGDATEETPYAAPPQWKLMYQVTEHFTELKPPEIDKRPERFEMIEKAEKSISYPASYSYVSTDEKAADGAGVGSGKIEAVLPANRLEINRRPGRGTTNNYQHYIGLQPPSPPLLNSTEAQIKRKNQRPTPKSVLRNQPTINTRTFQHSNNTELQSVTEKQSTTLKPDLKEHSEQYKLEDGVVDIDVEHETEELRQLQKSNKKKTNGGHGFDEGELSAELEKGKRVYNKQSKSNKQTKGHIEKESHKEEYEEATGAKNKFHKGQGFHGKRSKGEKIKKGKKHGEGKKRKKGHSTHGEHNVVKKDEYIKNTKFYDEEDDDEMEHEHEEQEDHHDNAEEQEEGVDRFQEKYVKDEKLKKGQNEKGHYDEEHKAYEEDNGSNTYKSHAAKHKERKGKSEHKSWTI